MYITTQFATMKNSTLRLKLGIAGISAASFSIFTTPDSAQAISLVKTIHITSAVPTYIQISEVVATQTGTGNDVALATAGATATALNTYGASNVSYAIDGIYPSAYPQIYHSNGTSGDYLDVTLANPTDLSSISIYGRTDFQAGRDIYNLALLDTTGNILFSANNLDANNPNYVVTVALPTTVATAVPEPFTVIGTLIGGTAALRMRKKLKVLAE